MKQMEFKAESGALPTDAVVLALRGSEKISAPYAFEIAFRTADTQLDGLGAVGENITLTIQHQPDDLLEAADPKRFRICGMVTLLEHGSDEGEHALYRLAFAPRLFLLSLSQHSRIFTDVTIPQILAAVLENEGVASVRFDLAGNYPKRAHVCQYVESSLTFISRLMEREGMFYFFEHNGDTETLVITDDFAHYLPLEIGRVRIAARGGADASSGDAFTSVARERIALPGRVVLTDYDELHPSLALAAESFVQEAQPRVVDYGEHLMEPGSASRYARIRSQIQAAQEDRIFARGGVIGLHAGGTFEFKDAGSLPPGSLPAECLVVEVEHQAVATGAEPAVRELLGLDFEGGYRTDATLIAADTQFRAPLDTPWPRVAGVEPARVDGAGDSPYAQIDEHGRYKVELLFDEGDLVDGSRSTWVRMLQPHGGAPDGFHFPLRKGTEVHIAFLGGDPDRPTIVGVAPNAEKPSTVTAANNTRNVLRTGSNNLWELEDQAGSQRVLLSTPPLATHLHLGAGGHQMELRTDGTGLVHTGADLDVEVGATKTEIVQSDLSETYRATHLLDVAAASTRTLQTSWTQTVLGPITNNLLSTLAETVVGAVTELYNATLNTHAVGAATITDNGTLSLTVSGGVAQERITAFRNITVGATGVMTVSGTAEETYGATVRKVHGVFTESITGTFTINAPKMLVYASDATIVDSGINALESGVSWVVSFYQNHIASGTSITGFSANATGIEGKFTGMGNTWTGLGQTIALAYVDLAAVRMYLDGSYLQVKGARMALKALHLII